MKKASITEAMNDHDRRLARLVRKGVVRPGRAPPLRTLCTEQPPRPKGRASASGALIEVRQTGR